MATDGYIMAALSEFTGREIGVSGWVEIDQHEIDEFADCTGDRQWIHVDVERARKESPYGGTIAHGYLTLSLAASLAIEAGVIPPDAAAALNYGLDKVRFIAPVKAGARVRNRVALLAAEYVIGGLADHITPWQGTHRTARLYGSRSTFALSNGGHIQSLINPPGNTRSWFMAGPARATSPDAWLKRQTKVEGSWWPHWREWIRARSGALARAPATLGSARHAPLAAAPGSYVFER